MAKPNYAFAKRQRDIEKKKKKEEKQQKKAGPQPEENPEGQPQPAADLKTSAE
jgi:hypothetical protein